MTEISKHLHSNPELSGMDSKKTLKADTLLNVPRLITWLWLFMTFISPNECQILYLRTYISLFDVCSKMWDKSRRLSQTNTQKFVIYKRKMCLQHKR